MEEYGIPLLSPSSGPGVIVRAAAEIPEGRARGYQRARPLQACEARSTPFHLKAIA
jgi:hypothetical protein